MGKLILNATTYESLNWEKRWDGSEKPLIDEEGKQRSLEKGKVLNIRWREIIDKSQNNNEENKAETLNKLKFNRTEVFYHL